jgi:hypothetical protein
MKDKSKLDEFGKFLMENLRDKSIQFAEKMIEGEWKAPSFLEIQGRFSNFSDEEKKLVLACIIGSIDNGIHDFLFALQEQPRINILYDETNLEELSDGLYGEIFTEEGWRYKFSKYGERDTLI